MTEQREAPALGVEPLHLPHLDPGMYEVACGPAGWYPSPPGLLDVPVRTPAPFDPAVFVREAAKSTEHVPHPAPEVTSTWTWEHWEEEWFPVPPRSFAKKARAAGWEVRIGFSRGSMDGRKANTYVTRDMIGVWIDGFGKRAVVIWERNPDAEFTAKKLESGVKPGEIPSGAKWSPRGGSIRYGKGMAFSYPNLTEMEEWVALQGAALPSWYEACRQRALAAETKRKTSRDDPAESTV